MDGIFLAMPKEDDRVSGSHPNDQSLNVHPREVIHHRGEESNGKLSIPSTVLPFVNLIPILEEHLRTLDKLADEESSENIRIRKKAIAEGSYHVSPSELARKLIDHMLGH